MERSDVTHFHKIDEDKKYLLLLIITDNKRKNAVNVQLSFRQGLNTWTVNDRAYRTTHSFNVFRYLKEPDKFNLSDKILYRRLLANEVPTDELMELFDSIYPGYIEGLQDRLINK